MNFFKGKVLDKFTAAPVTNDKKIIIGFGHQARVGKDTAAEHLVSNHDFVRFAFADTLKESARAIFGFTEDQVNGSTKDKEDCYWNITPRRAMQGIGDGLRTAIQSDLWVKSAFRLVDSVTCGSFVFSDVRYTNEANAIKERGGFAVKIVRPNAPKVDNPGHRSEIDMLNYADWDYVIQNDGTLEAFYANLDKMLKYFGA